MPELWQAASWSGRSSPRQLAVGAEHQQQQHQGQQQQLRLSSDNRPRRDQDLSQSSPQPSPRSSLNSLSGPRRSLQDSPSAGMPQQQLQLQQQALLPIEVLLSPLLPSADEAKLVDRLSQLRHAVDEHVRLAGGWEQQVCVVGCICGIRHLTVSPCGWIHAASLISLVVMLSWQFAAYCEPWGNC